MTTAARIETLPALPLAEWKPTLDTVHLWTQIIGKVRLAATPPRNHWWNAPLYVSARGLTTGRMVVAGRGVEIELDLARSRLTVATVSEERSFPLVDGLSVAEFHGRLMDTLWALGVPVTILAKPYGVPMETPFADDVEHASYDVDSVDRFRRILAFGDDVLQEFAGWFCGKSSPVHFFWHSFDLTLTRFSGRRAEPAQHSDPVAAEAYSHEVVSFGLWPGDEHSGGPSFYSYTAPEPEGLRSQPLRPESARWIEHGGGSLALLPLEDVRSSPRPASTVLDFLESAYRAGASLASWDLVDLASSWCPFHYDGLDAPSLRQEG